MTKRESDLKSRLMVLRTITTAITSMQVFTNVSIGTFVLGCTKNVKKTR